MMLTVNVGPFLLGLRIVGCYDNNFRNKHYLQKSSFEVKRNFIFIQDVLKNQLIYYKRAKTFKTL